MTSMLRVRHPGSVAVIGDIHGRADHLARLLERIPSDVKVLVAGDVCDRGPSTKRVIEMLIERDAQGVRGNHEEWLIAWARGQGFDSSAYSMGAEAALRSYGVTGKTPREVEAQRGLIHREHLNWLERLGLAMDLQIADQAYWLVHAGVPSACRPKGMPLHQVVPHLVATNDRRLLWSSSAPECMLPLDRPLIMGHMPCDVAIDTGSVIALDTGCGTLEHGYLSAVLLPERRFVDSR